MGIGSYFIFFTGWENNIYKGDVGHFSFKEASPYKVYSEKICDFANSGDEQCEYYRGNYNYYSDDIDIVQVVIEIPFSDFDISQAALNLKNQIDGEVYIDKRFWKKNGYWYLESEDAVNPEIKNIFIVWKSEDKLIMINFDDFNDATLTRDVFNPLLDKYFKGNPSS